MKSKVIFLVALFALFLNACNGSRNEREAYINIWIDNPLHGSTLSLGQRAIRVSLSADNLDKPTVDVFINGEFLANEEHNIWAANNGGHEYFAFPFSWEPAAPGSYEIVARYADAEAIAIVTIIGVPDPVVDEGQTPEIATEAVAEADHFLVLPSRDTNCRYGCAASLWEIADTLFDGMEYMPIGADYSTGYYVFSGPASGETCYVHESFVDARINGVSVDFEAVRVSDLVANWACPLNPTLTPTPLPTATPSATVVSGGGGAGATPPECSDGIDNDGDGATDFGTTAQIAAGTADRQCSDANDNDEAN
jgi:hypothetical protein